MTHSAFPGSRSAFGGRTLALAAVALAYGCYSNDDYHSYEDPYDPYESYGTSCEPGVDQSEIDRALIRELDAGEGVGGTIEYSGDGHWRVAVTCDLVANPAAQGQPCEWVLVVGALDGAIAGFEPEGLETSDVIEWYPGTVGSSVEDAVRLESITDVDIDAFTFETAPGAGIWISSRLDGYCGEPFLVWLSGGDDESTTSEMVELVPTEP